MRAWLAVVGVIALGPVLVALALRLPPVNQLDYADAWFYSAYAWVPKHHFAVFDWNYFSVRFPAILSIGIFERLFGTQEGYVVLRYLLAVTSGAAVYLGVRRFASATIALAAVALLYLHPFFSRMLLWDYSSFLTVAAGVVGFSLWWWTENRKPIWTALPGAALAVATYANVIVATALFILVLVEGVAALRSGSAAVAHLARRLAVALGSAIVVLAVGYVSYLRFSAVSPDDLLRPTIEFLLSNEENSALYQRPVSEWLNHELRVWAPIAASLALIAVLRGRVLATDVQARIAQVCIAYTAFFWLYRFAVTSSVIETWWAYSILVVVLAPAVGVLLHALAVEWRSDRRSAAIAVAVTALAAIGIRTLEGPVEDLYRSVADRPGALFAVVGVSCGLAPLLAVRARGVAAVAFAGATLAIAFMAWAPSVFDGRGTTGIFVEDGDLDWDTYAGGKQFIELVRDYDAPGSRVYTWYPDPIGPESIGWTTLPHLGTTVHQIGVPARMNALDALGRARLLQPDAAHVLTMSEQPSDLADSRRALESAGFQGRVVRRGTLADGRLRYDVIRLTGKPAG